MADREPEEMRESAEELEVWAGGALTEAEELRKAAEVIEEDEEKEEDSPLAFSDIDEESAL